MAEEKSGGRLGTLISLLALVIAIAALVISLILSQKVDVTKFSDLADEMMKALKDNSVLISKNTDAMQTIMAQNAISIEFTDPPLQSRNSWKETFMMQWKDTAKATDSDCGPQLGNTGLKLPIAFIIANAPENSESEVWITKPGFSQQQDGKFATPPGKEIPGIIFGSADLVICDPSQAQQIIVLVRDKSTRDVVKYKAVTLIE